MDDICIVDVCSLKVYKESACTYCVSIQVLPENAQSTPKIMSQVLSQKALRFIGLV